MADTTDKRIEKLQREADACRKRCRIIDARISELKKVRAARDERRREVDRAKEGKKAPKKKAKKAPKKKAKKKAKK